MFLSKALFLGIKGGFSLRVFVTEATKHIGSLATAELLDAGHEVVGLARSDKSEAALVEAFAQVHRGALDDLDEGHYFKGKME